MTPVSELRRRCLNDAPVHPDREFVVYWMTSNRRLHFNFALQRAVEWSNQLGRPLLILEALRSGYPWASDRLHAFILQGMNDNRAEAARAGISYYGYVEPETGHGRGLIESLAARSCVIITDDFPCFFLPKMQRVVADRIDVLMESVDSNGLLPMRAADQVFPTAYAFRRFLQLHLVPWLSDQPVSDPLSHLQNRDAPDVPSEVLTRWPLVSEILLRADQAALSLLPIDHSVAPVETVGGPVAGRRRLQMFLNQKLRRYADDRNQPDDDPSSGLSPYLHFGHVSVHEIFTELIRLENWTPDLIEDSRRPRGSREGWWQMSRPAEAFLDELITWRELGYNMCRLRSDYDRYESLPEWAQTTLREHAGDPRPVIYSPEQLRNAETHDRLWNAAQKELRCEGRMHNYLRMLWGKKILEWSPSPQQALEVLIDLNNRYALDGRNPNSYSGIFWVLGRYDRAWGPERPIYGKIRYMTSENTARKVRLTEYLRKADALQL